MICAQTHFAFVAWKTATHFSGSCSHSPNAHIKCALATMADMGFLKADHQRAEFRQAKPLRHLATQDSALGLRPRGAALASDNKHECESVAMRALMR